MTLSMHAPSTYLVAAAIVGLAFMAAGLIVLLFRCRINDEALAEQVRKLINANNTDRAIKLCSAADCPATTLCFYLMSIEERAEVFEQGAEQEGAGYREAAAAVRQVPFAERVAALAEREVRALDRTRVRRHALAATIGGLAAFVLGLAAWLLVMPSTGWRLSWIDGVALAGLLGAAKGLRTRSRIARGLRHLAATVVPLLRPVEEMNSSARTSAASARKAYERRCAPKTARATDES